MNKVEADRIIFNILEENNEPYSKKLDNYEETPSLLSVKPIPGLEVMKTLFKTEKD